MKMWPDGKWTELATRLILGCYGTAFQKLQLSSDKVTANTQASIQSIIEILGGQWGQIPLERKYETAEKALFRCSQRSDETNDSFLARADVLWQEMLNREIKLEELQAYITLRGSNLSAEDKKRVVLECESSAEAKLTMKRVTAAVRLLGAGFFQEVTSGKKSTKLKTYDGQATLFTDQTDTEEIFVTADNSESIPEEEAMDILFQEGDEDAILISDFEAAACDVLQSDEELAAAFTAYTDARRRLNDKMKSRGFWPIAQKGKSKGGGKSGKGKSGKGARKPLHLRILESQCKICHRFGHWKAECPNRPDATGSSSKPSQAPTSFVQTMNQTTSDAALDLEFLQLPQLNERPIDVSQPHIACGFMQIASNAHETRSNPKYQRLAQSLSHWKHVHEVNPAPSRTDDMDRIRTMLRNRASPSDTMPKSVVTIDTEAVTCFATHGSYGVLDLGATKTVIGSTQVSEFLSSLHPEIRKEVKRCPCNITFRFGNHGTLASTQAMIVPIEGLLLKIAIVPGSTPFLLSNTLLRALKAVIDTEEHSMLCKKSGRTIPLTLTGKGLFLVDLNDLIGQIGQDLNFSHTAETHSIIDVHQQKAEMQRHSIDTSSCDVQPGINTKPNQTISLTQNDPPTQSVMSTSNFTPNSADHPCSQQSRSKIETLECNRANTADRHVVVETSSADAGHDSGDQARLQQVLHGRDGSHEDRLRPSATGQELQGCLGSGAIVGDVVHTTLRTQPQIRAPILSALCGNEGGACRAPATDHSCDQHAQEQAQGIHEEQAHAQGICCPKDHDHGQIIGTAGGPTAIRLRTGTGPFRVDSRAGECGKSEPPRGRQSSSLGDGAAPLPDGEHDGSSDSAFGIPVLSTGECRSVGECPSLALLDLAGDVSADCCYTGNFSTETQTENQRLWKLVAQYTKELDECIQDNQLRQTFSPKISVLEVFCGPNSQLTHQARQLGYRAERCGRAQCDLQSVSGRSYVFQQVLFRRPKSIWFSPTCGPWAGFSNLNGSKSLKAWDDLQQLRLKHLEQIALGIVLFRHQRMTGQHFHWEQPRNSLMFRLPYLQEVLHYLMAIDVDLCVAGDLKDPVNQLPIRKTLTILTTSELIVKALTGLRCTGQHQHQQIEGQTRYQNQTMNRSTFTEHYPRKFARLLARTLGKIVIGREQPYRHVDATAFATEHPEAPPPKRVRTSARLTLSRTRPVSALPWGKRRRCLGKTTPVDCEDQWKDVFDRLGAILPRVGKAEITDTQIFNQIQELIPDKEVMHVRGCRGSSRTIAPPDILMKGEAPWRRSIYMERGTGQIRAEEEWEMWETLAKRQLIRPSHQCRLNITVFAKTLIPNAEANVPRGDTVVEVPPSSISMPDSSSAGHQVETPENLTAPTSSASPLTPSQEHDVSNPKQTDRFRRLSPEEQQLLVRAHKNLGHPSPERLSALLRSQGYRPEIAQAARELQCSVCQSQVQPKIARPSAIKDELDFNDRVCSDGITWTNKVGHKFHMYHIVDWSTSFQTACCAPDQSSSALIQYMIQMWFSWAGAPQEMLVDPGTVYNSEEFSQFAQAHNIKVTTTSVEAPFQNGKAERHGSILKTMLSKYEAEHPINSYAELNEALWWCVQAKNACSLRRGYAPEVLVLGKHTRVPGAISSDELLPAHLLAESETAHGVSFRKQLACREAARRAFHQADNDAALRRSILRRSRPGQSPYAPGEWVMVWRQGKGDYPGYWSGPQKVVVHENSQTIWTTVSSKLFRSAPEHVRPVTASEAKQIQIPVHEPSISVIAQQLPSNGTQGITRAIELPNTNPVTIPDEVTPEIPITIPQSNDSNSDQPDQEPETIIPENTTTSHEEVPNPLNPDTAVETPIPADDDEDLICDNLVCLDDEEIVCPLSEELAYHMEVTVNHQDIEAWKSEENPQDMLFIATAAKRQRSEVKISTLTTEEKLQFQKAKEAEIQNWIKTGTISRILRDQVSPSQIMRCRWILTWKPIDSDESPNKNKTSPLVKAKARLVILGYLDPQLEELPRDSPTLGRNAKMLLLQLLASKQWDLRSFDIRAAFLQGKPQPGRTLAVEPVPELAQALQLATNEICRLEKGAYGLVDAPYLWFVAISDELKNLGFEASPFDPCLFTLRDPKDRSICGAIGLHVDDGICGGNRYFLSKLDQLETKYPFGSKKLHQFTFTGVEMNQLPDYTIQMSQSKYVKAINPIHLSKDRKEQKEALVTEDERQALRAIVGSLQYAAVNTRPDLSSRISHLQSSINHATIETLTFANQTLYEAKKHHDTTIQIQPIQVEDFRFLAFSDASFASKGNNSSQTGTLIMGTHKDINTNTSCPVNPIAWGSKKIQRVVTSTLAAETVSLNSVLDHLSWLRLCWAWILDSNTNWKQPSTTLKQLPETYSTATYKSQNLPDSVAATDCKSLFDLVTRTAMPNCSEFRTQLNARAIKDLLAEGVSLRWVHSGAQLADSLTKIMDTTFLRETLRLGRYRLNDELEILKSRATNRNRLKWLKSSCPSQDHQGCNDECFLLENLDF